jgi:tRNA threonylcarbamoyladenosine biosynthesis protein TsaB
MQNLDNRMKEPYILNIESATEICSVSLQKGNSLIFTARSGKDLSAANRLPLLIDSCLQAGEISFEELSAVAVSSGPGSYTGLRIGMSLAKGICLSLQIPMISIPSLEILASGALSLNPAFTGLIMPMIDARRMEVYTAAYDPELNELLPAYAMILEKDAFKHFQSDYDQILLCGNGAFKVERVLENEGSLIYGHSLLSAGDMVPLSIKKYSEGMFSEINFTSPKYLKSANITTPKKPF